MPASDSVKLVPLPPELAEKAKRLDRRLPNGNKFQDLSGMTTPEYGIEGFVGFRGAQSVWLCWCRCGKPFLAIGAYLKRGWRPRCKCKQTIKLPPKLMRLRRLNRRMIDVNGIMRSITECAKLAGISREAMRKRVNRAIEHDIDLSLIVTQKTARPYQLVGTKHVRYR